MTNLTRTAVDLATTAHAQIAVNAVALPAELKNPLDGVSPDLTIFGGKINLAITLALGFVWAVAIVAGAYIAFTGLAGAKHAQKRSHEPEKITAGMNQFKLGLTVLVLGFSMPLIIGGIIIFVNRVGSGG